MITITMTKEQAQAIIAELRGQWLSKTTRSLVRTLSTAVEELEAKVKKK